MARDVARQEQLGTRGAAKDISGIGDKSIYGDFSPAVCLREQRMRCDERLIVTKLLPSKIKRTRTPFEGSRDLCPDARCRI